MRTARNAFLTLCCLAAIFVGALGHRLRMLADIESPLLIPVTGLTFDELLEVYGDPDYIASILSLAAGD